MCLQGWHIERLREQGTRRRPRDRWVRPPAGRKERRILVVVGNGAGRSLQRLAERRRSGAHAERCEHGAAGERRSWQTAAADLSGEGRVADRDVRAVPVKPPCEPPLPASAEHSRRPPRVAPERDRAGTAAIVGCGGVRCHAAEPARQLDVRRVVHEGLRGRLGRRRLRGHHERCRRAGASQGRGR